MAAAVKIGKLEDLSAAESLEGPPAPPAAPSREMLRSRRKRDVRARSISVKRMTKRELYLGRAMNPYPEDVDRPKTRAECIDGERPCPFVSCKHHLYLDVSAKTGAIKLNFPDIEPFEMSESCALDVAEGGGVTLEAAGAIMNLTRERIRQVEVKAMAKVLAVSELAKFRGLRDYVGDGPAKRRLPILAEDDEHEEEGEEACEDDNADGETDFDPAEFASDALDSE